VVTAPTHGTFTLSGAVVSYTPNSGYSGADSFTFQASNGSNSNVAAVTITVNPPPPVASSETVNAVFGTPTPMTLAAAGTGPFAYQVVANPAHGTLSGTGNTLTYTPTAGYAGNDSFTYTASNVAGPGNVATVAITIAPGFTWSVASGGFVSTTVKQGTTATYNLMLSGYTGATGSVAFVCSGAAINCVVSPNPGTLNGTAEIPVTVTVYTAVDPPSTAGLGPMAPGRWGWYSLLSVGGLLLVLPLRRRRPIVLCTLTLLALVGFSGCASVPQYPFGTATGTYTLTVTASTATASAVETLTLTVD